MPTFEIYGFALSTDWPLKSALQKSQKPADIVFVCRDAAPMDNAWIRSAPLYQSTARWKEGESVFTLYSTADGFVIHYADTADFYVSNERVHCHLFNPQYDYWVEIALLGPIMSFWMELQGVIALHASAVVIGEAAVAFVSSGGGGKTSLAASFVEDGHPLLTDDILGIEAAGDGRVHGRPGYPQIRLWPEQVERFAGDPQNFEVVHPDFSKRRVVLSDAGSFGVFHDRSAPLRSVYLLNRAEDTSNRRSISATRMKKTDSLCALIGSSFAAPVMESIPAHRGARLQRMANIVQRVPVFSLSYPDGYDLLHDVRRFLVNHEPVSG